VLTKALLRGSEQLLSDLHQHLHIDPEKLSAAAQWLIKQ